MVSNARAHVGVSASCVIVAFHRPEALSRLLGLLARSDIEILVVNVENDARVRQLDGATIIPIATNVGYAAAVNLGVREASAEVVVFMNDDLEVSAAGISDLVQRITSGSSDVTVPVVEDRSGNPWLMKRPPFGLGTRVPLIDRPLPDGPQEIDCAWGAIVAAKTSLVRAIPLPEAYFMYWEEIEWFYRARQAGARVEFIPSVRARHLGGDHIVSRFKSRLVARNAVRLVRRTRGRSAALRAWLYVTGWQCKLLLVSVLSRRGFSSIAGHAAGVSAALGAWREI